MSKDYAHRGNGGRQTAGGGMPGWVWLLAGVALGFAGAAIYYISRPAEVEQAVASIGSITITRRSATSLGALK